MVEAPLRNFVGESASLIHDVDVQAPLVELSAKRDAPAAVQHGVVHELGDEQRPRGACRGQLTWQVSFKRRTHQC